MSSRSSVIALAMVVAACSQPAGDGNSASLAAGNAAAADDAGPVRLEIPAGRYRLDKNHASFDWSIRHGGLSNYHVNFTRFDAAVTLDPKAIENSRVELTIDPAGLATHFPGDYRASHADSRFKSWEEDVSFSDRFLNAGKFPRIRFTSTRVEKSGDRSAKVTGDLTFLGVTRPVTLDVTLIGQAARHMATGNAAFGVHAEGQFARSDFGMARSPALGDLVTIRFDGEFQEDKPPQPGSPAAARARATPS